MLIHKYELFKMKPNEPIGEMFTRFCDITNSLQALGKGYSQSDLVRKILRSLTPEWEKKTTAIEEAKDLSNYSLENLIGNLTSYEVQMQEKENEKQTSKKIIALKTTTGSEESENDNDQEIALLTRKFRIFIKNRKFQKKGRFPEKSKDQDEAPLCFKCNKPRHLKRVCPLLKMNFFLKRI